MLAWTTLAYFMIGSSSLTSLKSPDPSAIVNERRVSKCVLMKNAEAENQ